MKHNENLTFEDNIFYPIQQHCPGNGAKEKHGCYSEEEVLYWAQVEYQQYCERYEPTYNPEDGSM